MGTIHTPVLFNEVMEALSVTEGGRFLDCTVGGAGHLEGILQGSENAEVLGLDRDSRAIQRAKKRLAPYSGRYELRHTPFSHALELERLGPFNGILADFGLSSDQLDEDRGLSFREDSPLDMRMDEGSERTAREVVNDYSINDLIKVLGRGGVRRNVKRYAGAILDARPIEGTKQLADIITNATPIRDRKESHPATVVFQAIRIEVNDELREIEILLDTVPRLIAPGGRCVCISFHSLEDKLVASRFRKWEGEAGPSGWPGGEALEKRSLGKLITKKAIVPTDQEISNNPRSRSARMRVFEFVNSKGE